MLYIPAGTHIASPVTPINDWRNCTEGVWWPWYIGSDIWCQDYFWEASSLGFQRRFSKAWFLEKVLASVLWLIGSWEMLSGLYPARFGVLFCSVVLGWRYLKLLGSDVSGARFLTEVWVCLSVTLHIVDLWQYQVCCTRSGAIRCTLFMVLYLGRYDSAAYTRCFDHISEHRGLWVWKNWK